MFEGGEYRMTNEAFAREIPFVICCVGLRGQFVQGWRAAPSAPISGAT